MLTRNPAVRDMKKLGLGIVLFFVAIAMNSVVASAQKNQPSKRVINYLSKLALVQVPNKIKDKNSGKIVEINKKDINRVVVPEQDAIRIIKVGHLSGKAQLCGEVAYQVANYQALMKAERAKNKWTPAQIIFINRLHLMTVLMTTGQLSISDKPSTEAERASIAKKLAEQSKKEFKKNCPAKEVTQIKKDIEAFVDSTKS